MRQKENFMRRLLVLICLSSFSVAGYCQQRFSNLLQFNYTASSGGGDGSIAGLKYLGQCTIGQHFTAGGGVGQEIWFDNRIKTFYFSSILGDARYYFKDNEAGSNFFISPGYALKLFDASATGYNFSTGLGSKIPLEGGQKLMVSLGFDFHNVRNEGYKRTFRGVCFNVGVVL